MAPPGVEEGWQGDRSHEESMPSVPVGVAQGYGGAGKGGKKKKKGSSCGFETLGLSLNVFRGVKRKGYQVPKTEKRKPYFSPKHPHRARFPKRLAGLQASQLRVRAQGLSPACR